MGELQLHGVVEALRVRMAPKKDARVSGRDHFGLRFTDAADTRGLPVTQDMSDRPHIQAIEAAARNVTSSSRCWTTNRNPLETIQTALRSYGYPKMQAARPDVRDH